jgi:hypothetical protein
MIVLKHVEHSIGDVSELDRLCIHLQDTTSRVPGIALKDILFLRDRDEFVLLLECKDEESYQEWREICPPPPGARDWYEVYLSREEQFSLGT